MNTDLLIFAIFWTWFVCGIISVIRESIQPYGGNLWLFDFVFGIYFLIADALHEYKENKKKFPEAFKS